MKGLNCYAQFSVAGGIKKSFTLTHDLKCFFVPGDIDSVQREPFNMRTVVGSGLLSDPYQSRAGPATVFFFALAYVARGLFGLHRSPPQPTGSTGHRTFLCLTFFTWRLCPPVGDAAACTLAGQPF